MEQAIDVILVGCMAFICALGVQEERKPEGDLDGRGHAQQQAAATPARVGILPISFALLPSDIAEVMDAQLVASAPDLTDKGSSLRSSSEAALQVLTAVPMVGYDKLWKVLDEIFP